MYSQADQLPNGVTLKGFDICIVGAGAAGIALATRLNGSSNSVLVLSNGQQSDTGTNPDQTRESIYGGILGPFMTQVDPIFLTRSRLNMYGGTTNHFWFFAHPMRAADLKPRPGYRDAAWPVGIEELNRFYPDANAFGDFGPFNYDDIAFWAKALHGAPFPSQPGDQLENAIWHSQQNNPNIYQFQTKFGPALQASQNVTVLFNAQALDIEATPRKDHVIGLACAAIDNDKPGIRFRVEARVYVLALGGVEPVRLLKLSGNLGDNAKGHLGRGFMLHPLVQSAAQVTFPEPFPPAVRNFFQAQNITFEKPAEKDATYKLVATPPYHPGELEGRINLWAWGMLTPTPEAMEREQIGAFHSNVSFNPERNQITLSINWESVPNENSTITLDESQTDPVFGQPVVRLDWNLLEQEKRTIIKGLDLCKQYFLARGASDFEITTDLSGGPEHWTFSPPPPPPPAPPPPPTPRALQAGDHHMGALRMSAKPEDGIVDRNLKVHTIDNLYIAGSGVYPTAGHENPTLTIVALALRLADHLKATASEHLPTGSSPSA